MASLGLAENLELPIESKLVLDKVTKLPKDSYTLRIILGIIIIIMVRHSHYKLRMTYSGIEVVPIHSIPVIKIIGGVVFAAGSNF